MKNTILSALLFILSLGCFAQSGMNKKEIENIATFTKVWGFLKYYHPEVAKGKLDWDKEFTSKINEAAKLNSKEDISTFYISWIDGLGKVKECKKCSDDFTGKLTKNVDYAFLYDSAYFSKELILKLEYIRKNRYQAFPYYANPKYAKGKFSKEKKYPNLEALSKEEKTLALARYWNIVNYYFPYKYLTDKDWNDVLIEMVPKFEEANEVSTYQIAIAELVSKINDSHANDGNIIFSESFSRFPAFKLMMIQEKLIVSGFYKDSLCKVEDIQLGDEIIKINGEDVSNVVAEKFKFLPASNNSTRNRDIGMFIMAGSSESLNITIKRNETIEEKTIKRYHPHKTLGFMTPLDKAEYQIFENGVGYLNLDAFKPSTSYENIREVSVNTHTLIVDLRNYPVGLSAKKLTEILLDENRPYYSYSDIDRGNPSVYKNIFKQKLNIFQFKKEAGSFLLYFFYKKQFNSYGKKNENAYKGKIILLVNEETQSASETLAMEIQSRPNTITVGSQTAGANGVVQDIYLPGNFIAVISGAHVCYPDGTETQRVGVKIDIEVKPTIEGIRQGRDEVLEKAIEVVKK